MEIKNMFLVGGSKLKLYFSISYMGCHPSHWRTHIFQDDYCTTNQFLNDSDEAFSLKFTYLIFAIIAYKWV